MLSLKRSDSGEILEKYSSSKAFEFENRGGNREKQTNLNGPGETQVKLFSAFGSLEDLFFDAASPPFGSCQEEITKLVTVKSEDSELLEPQKQKPEKFPLASLALLKNYRSRFRRLKGEEINVPTYASTCTKVNGRKVSTNAIIRLAGESFILSSSQRSDDLSDLSHPFVLGLSAEETKDVELMEYLLASAEKVGQQKFGHARKLLNKCIQLSSDKGNPIQRLVYYFCGALFEKIARKTGRISSNILGKKQLLDFEESVMSPKSANIAFHKELPFSQVSQFTGVQAIIEHVAEAKKVHIIDLVIMNGSNCIVLMQALAARDGHPLEHLKITAIGTKSKAKIEGTGKRLISFAESVNLPFSFNVVMVADMLDLKEDLFELDAEEVVAVHSSYLLSTMIAQSDRLEYVMRVIRNINPRVMVIIENEANHNSPVFVNRFIEALFYYGAFFDSLEDCMDRGDPNRLLSELIFFSPAIYNIVAAEGEERTTRQVNISVWRAFFARFGMVELELSTSSLYQASLVVKKFACGSSCTLDTDGKCLIIGWKGTPIHSLSAWKFV